MRPNKLLEIRIAIQNYISPRERKRERERIITAESTKLLSFIQGVGESDDNFLARHKEACIRIKLFSEMTENLQFSSQA